jgi:hypothetical protein
VLLALLNADRRFQQDWEGRTVMTAIRTIRSVFVALSLIVAFPSSAHDEDLANMAGVVAVFIVGPNPLQCYFMIDPDSAIAQLRIHGFDFNDRATRQERGPMWQGMMRGMERIQAAYRENPTRACMLARTAFEAFGIRILP